MSKLVADPPGRQGPGPMQGALVEALDLVLARRAAGAMPGERRAAGRGTGTELAQIRPYQFGDDVRRLDAAASARTGHPHVRDYVPERTLTTWLLVDVSASMAFGTADRLKSDVAEGVALVIGRLAVRRAGRVGLLTTGAPAAKQLPPRGGRAQLVALQRALGAGVAPDGYVPPEDALAEGIRRIGRLARGPGLIVVVSDFREGSGGEAERSRDTAGGARGRAFPPPGRASLRLAYHRHTGQAPVYEMHTSGRSGRARSAASPARTTCSPSRSSIRARDSCPTPGTSCSWTRRRASGSRPTPPAPSCGGASPRPSSRAATS